MPAHSYVSASYELKRVIFCIYLVRTLSGRHSYPLHAVRLILHSYDMFVEIHFVKFCNTGTLAFILYYIVCKMFTSTTSGYFIY